MKICPNCAFTNEERLPTCLWCNIVLAHVRSTPPADPNHPEHTRDAQSRERRAIIRGQLRLAAGLYALAIVLTAMCPGLIFGWRELLLFAGSSVVVAATMFRGWVGSFGASFLQGGLSLALALSFGPVQPLIFFTLLAHAVLPMLLGQWVEMIHDSQR